MSEEFGEEKDRNNKNNKNKKDIKKEDSYNSEDENFEDIDGVHDDDELASSARSDEKDLNSINVYMKEMGNIGLLNRQEEIEKSRKIDLNRNKVINEILKIPYTYSKIIEKYESDFNNKSVKISVLSKTIYLDNEKYDNPEHNFENAEKFLEEEEKIELPKVSKCEDVYNLIDDIRKHLSTVDFENQKFAFDKELSERIKEYNLNYVDFVHDYANQILSVNKEIVLIQNRLIKILTEKVSKNDRSEVTRKFKEFYPKKIYTSEFLDLFPKEKENTVNRCLYDLKDIEKKIGLKIPAFKKSVIQSSQRYTRMNK